MRTGVRGFATAAIDGVLELISELDQLLLRIALANTRRPPLLVTGTSMSSPATATGTR